MPWDFFVDVSELFLFVVVVDDPGGVEDEDPAPYAASEPGPMDEPNSVPRPVTGPDCARAKALKREVAAASDKIFFMRPPF